MAKSSRNKMKAWRRSGLGRGVKNTGGMLKGMPSTLFLRVAASAGFLFVPEVASVEASI